MDEKFYRNELSTLFEYSHLFKKERSKAAEQEVKKILEHEKNIIARINKIKEIDNLYEKILQEKPKEGFEQEEREELKKIKPKLKKTSFFQYFFHFRKKIIHMANETSIVVPKFWGLSYQISEESVSLLKEVKSNAIIQILPILYKVLEKGWKILSPEVYNLFFYLHEFLRNFVKNFIVDKKNLHKNILFIESFEQEYLTIMSNREYIRSIREGIYLFYGNQENEEMLSFLLFIQAVFDKNKKFSFINFILMLYTVSYHQVIDVNKIIDIKDIKEVDITRYLFIPKIKPEVEQYVEKIKEKQKVSEKKLFYLKHILDENNNIIAEFINEKLNPRFKIEFFSADLISACHEFLTAFLNYSKPLLISEVTVFKDGDVKRAQIFSIVWEPLVSKMEELKQEIHYQREAYKYLFITLSTYHQYILQNRHVSSEKDEKFCLLVSRLEELLFEFFETMVNFIYIDYNLTYNCSKEEIFDKLKTRNNPINNKQFEKFIPYSDYKIQAEEEEKVLEKMTKIVTLAGTFLSILGNEKISEKLKEKNMLVEESKRNIERLMRIQL